MLCFKPVFFPLFSFTPIKSLFSSSLLSAVRVVSFPYLRLLIFLLAILIPACDSSSPVFLVMYSAYKLNKHSDNMQPCHTPFPNRLICLSYVHEHIKNMLSHFSCVLLFVTLWAVACQAPLSMGFSRQEHWSGLSCPSPGDLPDPWIEPESLTSLALANVFFTTSATWEALLRKKGRLLHNDYHVP